MLLVLGRGVWWGLLRGLWRVRGFGLEVECIDHFAWLPYGLQCDYVMRLKVVP